MRVRSHHIGASLVIGSVVLASIMSIFGHVPSASATCGTGSIVTITSPPTGTNTPISGIYSFRAYTTPTTANGLGFMIINPSPQKPLGNAVQSGSEWRLDWDTRDVPNGAYQLVAIAHFGDTTQDCASPPATVYINNTPTQAPTLAATITPPSWQSPVGTSQTFTLDALYTDQYGRKSHVGPSSTSGPVWQSNIGTLSTQVGPTTVLNAGTTARTGVLVANITYAGLTANAQSQITVTPPTTSGSGGSGTGSTTSPSPTPPPPTGDTGTTSSGPTSGATADDITRLESTPTIFRPSEVTNSAPKVAVETLSCMEQKIGQAAFAEISAGKRQPTSEERRKAAVCFSGPEPIPAVLAPVTPSQVSDLNLDHDLVSVGQVKNTTITNSEGKKITGVLISGKGAPSSSLFIYIFSDPLVLRAETDKEGKWSYVLETPLNPGHHEIYAVSEKESGSFVRSAVVPVQIAAAAPGSSDGSLVIEQAWSPAQIGFVILGILLVLAAIGVVFTLLRRRKKAQTGPSVSPTATATIPLPGTTTPTPPAAQAPVSTPIPAPPSSTNPGIIMPTTAPSTPTSPSTGSGPQN